MTWDRVEGAIEVPADFTGVTGLAAWHEETVGQLSAAVVDGALRIRWQLAASVPEDAAARLADAFGTVLEGDRRALPPGGGGLLRTVRLPPGGLLRGRTGRVPR